MTKKILGWGVALGAFLTVMTSDTGMSENTGDDSMGLGPRFVIITFISILVMEAFFSYRSKVKGGRDAWDQKRKRLRFFGGMTDVFAMGVFVFLWDYVIISGLGLLDYVNQQNFWTVFAVLYVVLFLIFGVSYIRHGKKNK